MHALSRLKLIELAFAVLKQTSPPNLIKLYRSLVFNSDSSLLSDWSPFGSNVPSDVIIAQPESTNGKAKILCLRY